MKRKLIDVLQELQDPGKWYIHIYNRHDVLIAYYPAAYFYSKAIPQWYGEMWVSMTQFDHVQKLLTVYE